MNTEMLVGKAKLGDREALLQLIMNQKNEYYRLAYTYMGNQEDATDAMEDMIVILYGNINKLKKAEAFYSWSKTILANCCRKLLKKRGRVVSMDSIGEGMDDSSYVQKDEAIIVEEHLRRLSEGCQEAIRLRFYMDLDYQTIAEMMKIPLGTVKSRISIGLKKLRESLGGEWQ